MAERTKPVVVAVLDTGVYEKHKDLKDKIVDRYCCVKVKSNSGVIEDPDAFKDMTKDTNGHGTMVAGIIVLNGPINVKIVNIKVTVSEILYISEWLLKKTFSLEITCTLRYDMFLFISENFILDRRPMNGLMVKMERTEKRH